MKSVGKSYLNHPLPDELESLDVKLKISVQLSLIEIVIGSLGHTFKFPFIGHMLSLTQALMLSHLRFLKLSRINFFKQAVEVSAITSLFKSLSPGGKRLGPMISIFNQGILFGLGPLLIGVNSYGLCLGICLLSAWAFFQPLLTYYIVFGSDLFAAYQYAIFKLNKFDISSEHIIIFFVFLYLVKCSVGVILIITSLKIDLNRWQKLENKILGLSHYTSRNRKAPNSFILDFFIELTHPFFIITLGLLFSMLYFQGKKMDQILIHGLRPIAIMGFIFFIGRSLWVKKLITIIRKKSNKLNDFFANVDTGLKTIQSFQQKKDLDLKNIIQTINQKNYQKILILGPPGSGKTTLAKILAKNCLLQHIEVDKLRWEPGQKGKNQRKDFEKSLNQKLKKDDWIIEGAFRVIQNQMPQKVDLIIKLDPPSFLILYRLFIRDLKRLTRSPFSQTSDFLWYMKNGRPGINNNIYIKSDQVICY